MKLKLILAASLSLTLAACAVSAPAPTRAPSPPPAMVAPAASVAPVAGSAPSTKEKLKLRLRLGKREARDFATKVASLGQLAFVRIEVVGEGFSGTLTQDGPAFIPVTGTTIEATVSDIPHDTGALRVVTLLGYDADQNLLEAFELDGYYVSASGVSQLSPTLSRRDVLLGRVLRQILTDDPDLLADLDIDGLQTVLDDVTGYAPGARDVFEFDPSEFDPADIVPLLPSGGGPLPDASTITTAAQIPLQTVNLTARTPNGGAFAEAVTLQLDDPNSEPVQIPSQSTPDTAVAFTNVPAGNWILRAFGSDGALLAQTAVTSDAGGVTIGQDPFVLTGVEERFLPFQINTTTTLSQLTPRIAIDDEGKFVAVWLSINQDSDGTFGVYGQRFDSSGAKAGAEFQLHQDINGRQTSPDVAMDPDGDFVVAWDSEGGQDGDFYGIFARRFDKNGNPLANEFQVNTHTTGSQRFPMISVNDSGAFVIVWVSANQEGAGYEVYGQRYDNTGTQIGGEFRVNDTTNLDQYEPKVSLSDTGSFVVTWTSGEGDGSGDGVFAKLYDAAGNQVSGEFQVNQSTTDSQGLAAVAMDAEGDFVIAWNSYGDSMSLAEEGIFARRYNAAGVAQSNEFRVETATQTSEYFASVGVDLDGDFVIAWSDFNDDTNRGNVNLRRFSKTGTPLGDQFQVNADTTNVHEAICVARNEAGKFVTAWTANNNTGPDLDGDEAGIFGLRFGNNGLPE
ncbi:MAG: hypothetical protein ACAI44_14465 [Candidatus Sericytochromatia bacterium]